MTMRRMLAAMMLACAAFCSSAASVGDRSPFYQGLWWNSARSGNGFDIFNVGDYVMVLWYTYDADGRPIWYCAEGSLAALKSEGLDLVRHRWHEGRKAPGSVVGRLRFDVRNPERIDLTWTLGSSQSTWALRPFIQSGVIAEEDRSGTWYEPEHGGWGLSYVEQGDARSAIVYTYDASGAPTWVAGFGRGTDALELQSYDGACPMCTYRASTTTNRGLVVFEARSESELALRTSAAFATPAGIRYDGALLRQLSRPASTRAVDRQLAHFPDEASLRDYFAAGFASGGGGGFSAAPAPVASPPSGAQFSATNVQVTGVDEADLVKTDGRHIYTYLFESNLRKPVIRIARTDGGSSLEVRGTYSLASGPQTPMFAPGLFLAGSTLVSVATGSGGGAGWLAPSSWTAGNTHVEAIGVANPDAPTTLWRAEIDGYVVSTRRIGDRIYLVMRYAPVLPPGTTAATAPLQSLLPQVRVNGSAPSALLDPASVHSPPQGERLPSAQLTVVVAIDLAGLTRGGVPRIAQALAIVGTPETAYVSLENMYVATSRSSYQYFNGGITAMPVMLPYVPLTDIHRIRLALDHMQIVGTGTVEGYLSGDADKAAFRMGERNGELGVVTGSASWAETTNRLTILAPSARAPGLLRTVSFLPNARRPERLGKPGEVLFGTRFVESRLYAVTFKRTDPLYVVDLSDSSDPRIAGELEIPGFSDYLHPLSSGLLLGFGKDACPASSFGDSQFAWYQGLQLTLFDVSDPSRPREMQRLLLGKRGSESALLRHHHAFSVLPRANGTTAIAIPGAIHEGTYAGCGPNLYPWKESALMQFEITGDRLANTTLAQKPSLVTHAAARGDSFGSAASMAPASDARSILFPGGTIYVGGGQFWRQDTAGNTFGPF